MLSNKTGLAKNEYPYKNIQNSFTGLLSRLGGNMGIEDMIDRTKVGQLKESQPKTIYPSSGIADELRSKWLPPYREGSMIVGPKYPSSGIADELRSKWIPP